MELAKYEGWFFLLIALMWLLPMVGVGTGAWGGWVATVALVLVGVSKLQK
tara:strand:+ start:333 stop:482 length:150 start_codon:yes stop_codon:yes gene_type:complete